MIWAFVIALAALSFAALVLLRVPRMGREAVGAALMVGIAGYALQGRPDLAGAPKEATETISGNPAALVAERKALDGEAGAGGSGISGNRHVIIADALSRHGQFADAAAVLLGAVEDNPNDGEAWLALANALTGHADGTLTPASLYAYGQAMRAAPGHPGPAYFLGLALASSGRYAEARELWTRLLAATPPDAPWRKEVEGRLRQLDAVMAQGAAGPFAPSGSDGD